MSSAPPPEAPDPPQPPESQRRPGAGRKVLLPLLVLLVVSGIVFALAKLQPFEKEVTAAAPGTPVALGDPARGADLYAESCAGCHGGDGEGGVGPALRDNPISLADSQAVIQQGQGGMPAGLVTGADEADVLAHLATLLQDGGAPPAPAGDPAAGATAFASTCAGCHGDAGAGGGVGPTLAGEQITAEETLSVIASGRGTMPGGLAEGLTAQDIAAYLVGQVYAGAAPPAPTVPPTAPPPVTASPPPTAPPPVTAPPGGDPVAGADVFAASCAGCHGDGGIGGSAPALAGVANAPDEVRQVVVNGRGGMPAGLVSGADLENVLAYVTSIGAPPTEPGGGVPGGTARFAGPSLDRVRVDLDAPAPADWTVTVEGPGGRIADVLTIPAGATTATSPPLGRGILVADYDRVSIGPSAEVVRLAGALSPAVVDALRTLLVRAPDTPDRTALVPGGRAAMTPFARYAGDLTEAIQAGDLPAARFAAEALVNTVRGAPGRDLDGDGAILTPGDGYGLLGLDRPGYVSAERAAVEGLAATEGLPPDAAEQARLANGAARATGEFLGVVVEAARRVAGASSVAAAGADASLIDALDGRIVAGQERVAEYVPGIAVMPLATPAGG